EYLSEERLFLCCRLWPTNRRRHRAFLGLGSREGSGETEKVETHLASRLAHDEGKPLIHRCIDGTVVAAYSGDDGVFDAVLNGGCSDTTPRIIFVENQEYLLFVIFELITYLEEEPGIFDGWNLCRRDEKDVVGEVEERECDLAKT